jgi:hypothetical protein
MSTGITAQGGTDRLNRILKLYQSTSAKNLSGGGGPTALIVRRLVFSFRIADDTLGAALAETRAFLVPNLVGRNSDNRFQVGRLAGATANGLRRSLQLIIHTGTIVGHPLDRIGWNSIQLNAELL